MWSGLLEKFITYYLAAAVGTNELWYRVATVVFVC